VAGAVLDMPLSDKTGFKDISGNDNHGTNYGADIIGEAGGFDGVNDYVDCGAGEHLNITDAITISAWVKLFATAANYQIIVSKRQTDVQWILGRDYTDNKWRFWVSSNGSDAHAASDNSIVETGLWVHLVGAYTGTALKFYRDGVEVYSGSYSLGIHSTLSDHVQIGRQLTGYYFNGQISDVKVYNRALSDGGVSVGEDAKGEIGALYDKGRSGSSVGTSTTNLNKGLVGQWDLKSKNEKVGGELVANGINWNDGNEDGLADGYSTLGVNAITTITTGSGFSGNIQKIEAGVTENTALIWDTSLEVGKVYRITAKVKTNNGGALHLVYGETATVSVPGDSAVHKIELTSQITQQYAGQIRFYVRSTAGDAQAGDWIEVDEFSVKELKTADSTPYGNHGTIYGATVGDDYTSFDGDGDYVESPDNNLVLNGNGEHKTVVAWVYQTTASQDRVAGVFESQGSSQPQYALFLTGSKLRVQLKDSSGYFCDAQSSLSYSAGTWEHIVFTYDESYVHFYLNGESAGSTACSGDIRSDSSPYFYIGTRGDIYINEMFNGNISNIKIYNRSLSGAEAKLLYDKGR